MANFNNISMISSSHIICIILVGVALFMMATPLNAQEVERKYAYRDQIFMTDGSRFVGEIIEMSDDVITLQLTSGGRVPLIRTNVKRIYQHLPSGGNYGNYEPSFMDFKNNYFFGLDVGLSFGQADFDNFIGLEIAGYFKRKLNTRHLIGLRNTYKIYPAYTYLELSSNDIQLEYNYLLSRPMKITPYVSARVGTGFIFRNEYYDVRNKGLNPNGGIGFGLLKSIGNRSAFFYEISYNYQTYHYEINRAGNKRIQKDSYGNLAVRIGYWF